MMNDLKPRILTNKFEQELESGFLKPFVTLVQRDRDLIAEIRSDRLDVYCKGNLLIGLQPIGDGSYRIQSDEKFLETKSLDVREEPEVDDFCRNVVPFIKQRIAEHSRHGKEVEFEQMLIRSMNFEPLNTEYIAVDRQAVGEDRKGRTDVDGVFWPGGRRGTDEPLAPALIEVKYGVKVDNIAEQVGRYYGERKNKMKFFVERLQAQLRQKARLGLLPGLDKFQKAKIQKLPISNDIEDLRVVIALVDYNPRSRRFADDALRKLPFANQIDLFYLGFGMWKSNSAFRGDTVEAELQDVAPGEGAAAPLGE